MAYVGFGYLRGFCAAALGLATLGLGRGAAACGGGGIASQAGVVVDAQRVVISVRSNGTTDIVAQVSVPQTTADYGLLIPVPTEPVLDDKPVLASDLASLDQATEPSILTESDGGSSSGCGCGAAAADAKGAPTRGVTAGPPVEIGPVVAVSLTADTSTALLAWLGDNGFVVPSGADTTLSDYVGEGHYFIAIRRSERAPTFAPSSIGIHYSLAGDHRTLSLGFTRLGAAPVMAYTVFVATREAVAPSAPFAALTLADLDGQVLKQQSYKAAVQAAVSARGGQAFVLESATPAKAVVPPGLASLFDPGAVLTRATTVVSREALADDVAFATPFTREVPNTRFASQSLVGPRAGSFGSVGAAVVAGVLRRRRRGR